MKNFRPILEDVFMKTIKKLSLFRLFAINVIKLRNSLEKFLFFCHFDEGDPRAKLIHAKQIT